MGVVNITEQANWIVTQALGLINWISQQKFQIGNVEVDFVSIALSILAMCIGVWLLRESLWG